MRPRARHDDSPRCHCHNTQATSTSFEAETAEWHRNQAETVEWDHGRCCAKETKPDEWRIDTWLEAVHQGERCRKA
jgi:hypothetical protein